MTLTQRISAHLQSLGIYQAKARSVRADPRDQHEAETSAKDTAAAIDMLTQAHAENTELAAKLETAASQIEAAPYRSAERSTAVRKMREAAMWLAREAGDPLPKPSTPPSPAAKKSAKK